MLSVGRDNRAKSMDQRTFGFVAKQVSITSHAATSIGSNVLLSRLDLHEAPSDTNDKIDDVLAKQLLTHVPDSIVEFNHKKDMPATKEFLGVVLFADISGFTALTEKYSNMATSDGTSGTDKLSATLNAYIGKIVDEIINCGGDILKFAGDAILAIWRCSDIGHNAKAIINKVVNCSIDIQDKCDDYETEVGIVLRVKLAVAVGHMCITYVGLPTAKQFDLSGGAVDDVGITEKQATPGSIILSQLAWANCDQHYFAAEPLEKGKYYKISGHAHSGSNGQTINTDKNKNMATFLHESERVVTSPMDDMIDQCVDYLQDMPKALMLDDEEKTNSSNHFVRKQISENNGASKNKKKKFERISMTINLINGQDAKHLRAYVPEPVLYKLDHGQGLEWLSEMRQVSVLFINMKLPDPPKEASNALQKAFEIVYEACIKYKGNLNKVFGFDKGCTFVLIFGLPGQKLEDDAYRALSCAHHIYDTLHAVAEISNESIGVTTGLAFCGVIGHKNRHEYTVIGSKVNMAARLMMYYPNILTCDNDTYEASVSKLRKNDFKDMPFIELKGLKDPGVVREYNPNASKNMEDDDIDFPIIGRQEEMAAIGKTLKSFHCHDTSYNNVIAIQGDAGAGKTRLLEEFMDKAEEKQFRVIHIEGDLLRTKSARHIINQLATSILQLDDNVRCNQVVGLIHTHEDQLENIGLLHDLLGSHVSSHNIAEIMESERAQRRNKVLIKLLRLMVNEEATFIAIDNARFIDEQSWSFLYELVTSIHAVFCFSIRTISSITYLCADAKTLLESTQQLSLVGLENQDLTDYICQLLEVNEIPKKISEVITIKSQGIPSWCKQLIKEMVDASIIQIISKSYATGQANTTVIVTVSEENDSTEIENNDGDNDRETISSLPEHAIRFQHRQQRRGSEISGKSVNIKKSALNESIQRVGNSLYSAFKYNEEDYARASKYAIPFESEDICILSPNADLKKMLAPSSVKDMVLARMDRMTLSEQTIIKCAAALGLSFTKDLLKAIIPKNCVNMLDTSLYTLGKQQFLECGSLALQSSQQRNHSTTDVFQNIQGGAQKSHQHTHNHGVPGISNVQVLCGCYSFEGFPVINLSQANAFSDHKKRACLYFQFRNTFVQETAYALWLEDQRKSLLEKAAFHLEKTSHKCRSCGGNGFIPGHGKGISVTEQLKHGSARRFSSALHTQQRRNRAFSKIISTADNQQLLQNVQEEAHRVLKNCRAEHIKNHIPQASNGERIGLALIQMARAHAIQKEANDMKDGDKLKLSRFYRHSRVHPSGTVGTLAAKTLLMKFQGDSDGIKASRRNDESLLDACEIDLSQCQCAELNATILPQLVFYWKAAGNLLKAFHYTIDAAAAFLVVDRSMKALALLDEVDQMIVKQEEVNFRDYVITDEERARIESLKGQAKCSLDCIVEGIAHFQTALKYLHGQQPTNWLNVTVHTWKASLVQTLHRKMPGVFMDTKSEEGEMIMEQVRVLGFLSKACTCNGEHERAYLANLEQINLAEETNDDCWTELIQAYTNMVFSCQIYCKFTLGRFYQQLAMQKARLVTVNAEDMITLGNCYITLTKFNIADGDLNAALTSGQHCQRVASQVNDLNLKISIIPILLQIYLMKYRCQSCNEMLKEMQVLVSPLEEHTARWMYFYCCVELMLYTGDCIEDLQDILNFVNAKENEFHDEFVKGCIKNAIALWFVRTEQWTVADVYFKQMTNADIRTHSDKNSLLVFRALSIQTEYFLHEFRRLPCNDTRNNVQRSLSSFKTFNKGNKLFQGRLFHLQAYFAFLKRRENRAKLLLEDCVVISKNVDITYEHEWALASKLTWLNHHVDMEPTLNSTIKYILPHQ